MTGDTRLPEDRLREAAQRLVDDWTGDDHQVLDTHIADLRAALATSRPAPDTRTETLRARDAIATKLQHERALPALMTSTGYQSGLVFALGTIDAALSETPSEAPPTEPSLDTAWKAAEEALQPGEYLAGFSRYDDGLPWAASARTSGDGKRHNIVTGPFDYHGQCTEFGETPAAALLALATRLQESANSGRSR